MKRRATLKVEVEQLLRLGTGADANVLPDLVDVSAASDRRQPLLVNLIQAEAVLQARAEEHYRLEQAEYEVKLVERATRQQQTGRKPRYQGDSRCPFGIGETAGRCHSDMIKSVGAFIHHYKDAKWVL